jgi:flagellar motor component MotA
VDLATVFACGAFGSGTHFVVIGGIPGAFVDIPSVLIVVGCTFVFDHQLAVGQPLKIGGVIRNAFFHTRPFTQPDGRWSNIEEARKEGILALESASEGESINFYAMAYKWPSTVGADGIHSLMTRNSRNSYRATRARRFVQAAHFARPWV